jgi:hypothetical protein
VEGDAVYRKGKGKGKGMKRGRGGNKEQIIGEGGGGEKQDEW